jgi:hypothetical protein
MILPWVKIIRQPEFRKASRLLVKHKYRKLYMNSIKVFFGKVNKKFLLFLLHKLQDKAA